MHPNQIISLMSYKGQNNTLALPGSQQPPPDHLHPHLRAKQKTLPTKSTTILKPRQWIQLINRISQIPEPTIPTTPSKYAVKTNGR